MLSKAEVDEIKRMYPQGMKIRLIEMQGYLFPHHAGVQKAAS